MRTPLCVSGGHVECNGRVNKGTSERPRWFDCTCTCHGKKQHGSSHISGTTRRAVKERDGFVCRARVPNECTQGGDHVHHVRPVGRGGDDELSNLITVCADCHNWIHAHPRLAKARGLLR